MLFVFTYNIIKLVKVILKYRLIFVTIIYLRNNQWVIGNE